MESWEKLAFDIEDPLVPVLLISSEWTFLRSCLSHLGLLCWGNYGSESPLLLLKRGFSKTNTLLSSEVSEFGEDYFEVSVLEDSFEVSLTKESE